MVTELGPVSRAMLNYVQERPFYIDIFRMMHAVQSKTGERHMKKWYFRRLVALALEGRIEAKVNRIGDHLNIRFRRLQNNVLDDLPGIEEAPE